MKKILLFIQIGILSYSAFAEYRCDYENYNGQDLSNRVFDGGRNSEVFFRYTTWVGANLSNSRFGVVLGVFPNQHGQKIYLTGADFTDANLSGVLFDAKENGYSAQIFLDGAVFENANISYAKFYGASGFTKEQLYSTASYKNKNLRGIELSVKNLSGWNFSGQDLTSADLGYSSLTDADFSDSIITNAFVSTASKEQIYSTRSYKEKNLNGVALPNIRGWDLSGQNLMSSKIVNYGVDANLTNADLRNAKWRTSEISPFCKNTLWTDGEIKNFSMASAEDSFSIRKYVPATEGGEMINAKIVDDATISGGAVLTLEEGAILEVAAGKTLTVSDGEMIFNIDVASNDTKLLLNSGSKLVFDSDSKITINLDGEISADDSYAFSVIQPASDSYILGMDSIQKENITLNVNGETYDADKWGIDYDPTTGEFNINVNIPEPATYAALFGGLALLLAFAKRRR